MDKLANNHVPLAQGLAYSLPVIVTCFLFYPVQMLLAGIYAKYFGLALTTIATIVFAARLFDAITDPLIGYCSDRYRARTGTRKPWIVTGSVLLVICSYFLWVPPSDVNVVYFLGWYFAFYLAWTIVDIPHLAWGGELTTCGHEKTRVYSLQVLCRVFGGLLFTAVPFLPFFASTGFTPETLKWSVLASSVVVFPLLVLCVTLAPNGRASIKPKKESFRLLYHAIIQNKPLLILLAGYFLISLSYGMYIGLSFIFADTYLGLGDKFPMIFSISLFASFAGAWVPYKLSIVLDKAKIYGVAVIVSAMALISAAFVEPGVASFIPFTVLTSLIFSCNAVLQVIVPSLLSDIIDYSSWKFGADRAATYFSTYLFLQKTNVGMGGAFGLALIGWYGFDATAVTHTQESILGLRLAIAYAPALLMISALFLISKLPINERRHAAIQQRLASRIHRNEKQKATHSDSKTPSTNAINIVDQ